MILANILKSRVAPIKSQYSGSFLDQLIPSNVNYTIFNNVDIGQASTSRLVVFALHWNDSAPVTVNSITIGGVSGTEVGSVSNGNQYIKFYTAYVPVATNIDVIINLDNINAVAAVGAALWVLWGVQDPTPVSVYSSINDPATVTGESPNGGIILGVAASGATSSPTISWTNMSANFLRYDAIGFAGATKIGGLANSTLGADFSSTSIAGRCALYAVWR